ncbi:MAG: carboxylesterase family protein [Bacilli bacterium]|nr:carboxylesterase family protein [Bacilli bacterium]
MELKVKTEYGYVLGKDTPRCAQYLGIPYAKPPLGELRFRHPVKPDPWDEAKECRQAKNNPIQRPGGYEYRECCSEDCLYLNVYVPHNLERKVPVMVWIHGGAYEQGGNGRAHEGKEELNYDLSSFCEATKTVVVALSYRLNVFGFLYLHAFSDRFDANNGLYDLKMGLEFVKDNIENFGGDKDNITVFGESAGGALTLACLSSDLTSPLFHKAISQSPCVDHFFDRKLAEKIAKMYIKALKVKDVDEIASLSVGKLRSVMNKVADSFMMKGHIEPPFSPTIDGEFLKELPSLKIKKERTHPLLIGTISHEGDLFLKDLSKFLIVLMNLVTPVKAKKGKDRFWMRSSDALTDHVFLLPSEDIAYNYKGDAYMYYYDYTTLEVRQKGCRCYHGADIAPLFDISFSLGSKDDPNLIPIGKYMKEIWKSFAYGKLDLKPYKENRDRLLITLDTSIAYLEKEAKPE